MCGAGLFLIIWSQTMPNDTNMEILKTEWPDQAEYMEYNFKMYLVTLICYASLCFGIISIFIALPLMLGLFGFIMYVIIWNFTQYEVVHDYMWL